MAIEHHLGMTCDPVEGLVQVPCIERCSFATLRALDCADYALMSDGRHLVSYDEVVLTLKLTGNSFSLPLYPPPPLFFFFLINSSSLGEDIREAYRETAGGGLAKTYKLDEELAAKKSTELINLREKAKKQAGNCSTCGSSSPCSSGTDVTNGTNGKMKEKEIF